MESHELKTLCIDSIAAACVSKGKRKGALKATCPPTGSNAAAARQMLFMGDDQRAIYDAITAAIADVDLRGMDKDRVALEGLGAW
tara:strand:- start:32 stop:286 length:255 start_codon:yes stop_codon:yes gene_type:complete